MYLRNKMHAHRRQSLHALRASLRQSLHALRAHTGRLRQGPGMTTLPRPLSQKRVAEGLLGPPSPAVCPVVVFTAPFINFLLHNHFITEKILKKKSGDVNDEANFSLFILLQERAKPILPPYPHPHLRARTQTFTPPLHPSLKARGFIKPSVLTLTHPPKAF